MIKTAYFTLNYASLPSKSFDTTVIEDFQDNLLLVEVVVTVDDCEHLLIKNVEEFIHHFGEVKFSSEEISLKLDEKVAEHVRILFVDNTVGLLEHLMKSIAGLRKKRFKKF